MRVRIVDHDPGWRRAFAVEACRIRRVLGDIVVAVHHIGSTSIAGMPAKPVIDILLEVTDPVALDRRSAAMEDLGYEAMGEFGIPGRRFFRKDGPDGARTHHVHAYGAHNHTETARHVAFRDYMIAHPREARRYGELKQALARAHPDDIQAYMDGKDGFIGEHQARALAWREERHAG